MTKEINNKVYRDEDKFYMEADIQLHEETDELRKEASSVVKLPGKKEKQPDLSYFSAIFVSSGTNLNLAHFMPSELVSASDTVTSKAVDVEHSESDVIGHIYDCAFTDLEGNKLDLKQLASMETATLDLQEMHVVIAGIIYKNRFPNISKEVAEGKWKVSMEAYYQDYDVKVGNLILSKKEAEMLGFDVAKETQFGKMFKVIKQDVEIASGNAARVLRGICFSGVGFVKNAANPPSVVLETANKNVAEKDDTVIILNYDDVTNEEDSINVTSPNIEASEKELKPKEKSELEYNDTVGICVSFKKQVIDSTFEDPDTSTLHENWCALYETSCTSFSRDTTDPKCLRNQVTNAAKACVFKLLEEKEDSDKRGVLVKDLYSKVTKAAKLL